MAQSTQDNGGIRLGNREFARAWTSPIGSAVFLTAPAPVPGLDRVTEAARNGRVVIKMEMNLWYSKKRMHTALHARGYFSDLLDLRTGAPNGTSTMLENSCKLWPSSVESRSYPFPERKAFMQALVG